MYGFKPKGQRQAAQHLADGGFVATAKRMMGFKPDDPAQAARLAEYKANAAREKAAAAAPAPAPPAAVTQYTGMSAMQRREKEQGLADGGLVAKMKSADAGAAPFGSRGLNQMRDMPAKMQAMGFGPAKAEAPAPAPVTDPRAAKLQAMIPQIEAMGFKQAQAAADGGMIRGPGDGTSDSIPDEMEPGTFIMPADSTQALGLDDEQAEGEKVPVRVSNGEYELPPERVQAVGAAVLQAIKGMTHTPTDAAAKGEGEPMAQGFKPKGEQPQQFFAEGGRVKSPEELARLQNQTAMYVQGAQAAAANRPPEAPANQPTAQPMAKPIAAAPQPSTSPSGLYMQDRAQELREQASAGNYAQAAGTAARTAVQGLGMYGIEMADKAVSPIVNAAAGFGRGLIGSASAAEPATPAGTPPGVTTGVQTASTPAAASTTAPSVPTPPPVTPTPAATAPAAPPAGVQVAPGAYKNAPGQYSDSPTGAPVAAGFTGKPSAQNDAAASNLAQRNTTAPAPAAAGFPGVTAPTVRNSTNDWATRNNLRNLEVSASSITNNGGRFDRSGPGDSAAMAAYKAALGTDQVLQQAQPGADVTAMRENAGLQREGVQQTGANTRAGMQEAGANSRDAARMNLAGQELGMKREAQGFQTRAAQQLENLQTKYTAEKDPAKQAAIARQIRAVQGKTDPAEWAVQVTPTTKNPDGSTSEGSVIRYNKATGQAERVDVGGASKAQGGAPAQPTSKAEYDALPKGAQYVKNGVVYVKG